MSLFSSRMGLREAADFCQRFGTGLRAGLDVLKLLDNESRQGSNGQKQAMQRLAAQVRAGDEVGEAMAKDEFFPTTLSALMAAGDESGKVDRALLMLARHYKHRVESKRKFIKSITFPLLQLVGGIAVISLLIYVMGILTPAGGGEMTDVLGLGLRGGDGVLKLWGICAVIVAIVLFCLWGYSRNLGGVQNVVPIFYMIPKLGGALQTITLSKFCTAMALAFEAGLDPIRSIELGMKSTASAYYQSGRQIAENAIRGGADLAGALEATHLFPGELLNQVDIAEQSGTSAEAMNRLAEEYDRRAETAIAVLAGIATFIIRGVVILFFVFMIMRIAMTYLAALNGAFEPI